jgi:hypothetical protein
VTYKIARDGQEFGPYSLSDVQRYVGTGNILPTDLARAEGTTDWLPVSQVIGTIAVPQQLAPLGYAAASSQYPDPPNLQWWVVLLIAIFTCGLFLVVWDFVQVLWVKKVEPTTKVFRYFLIFIGLYVLNILVSFAKGFLVFARTSNPSLNRTFLIVSGISIFFTIVSIVMMIVYRFTMRTSLLQHFNGPDPVGLSLSGIMTFFFGSLYFQFHFNRINEIKNKHRFGNTYRPINTP